MNANDCRTVRGEIDTSELGQRLSGPVETHVNGCAACAQFRTERAQLRELVGSLKPVAAPPDFDMRLRARIAREKDASARQPFIFRFAMTTPAIAIAALIVLTIASLVWINQRNQKHSPEVAGGNPRSEKPATAVPLPANSSNLPTQPHDGAVAINKQPSGVKHPNSAGRTSLKSGPSNVNEQEVSEFNTKAAPSIRQNRDRAGEVWLNAPSKPMVVSVQDASGATHKISLPPISFGSQRFDSRTQVSMKDRRDW